MNDDAPGWTYLMGKGSWRIDYPETLSAQQVRDILARITFKPTYLYRLNSDTPHFWEMDFTVYALDSTLHYPPANKIAGLGLGSETLALTSGRICFPDDSDRGFTEYYFTPKVLRFSVMIPYYALDGEPQFLDWFRSVLHYFENHEIDEWFKIDGVCVNEPHPERKTQPPNTVRRRIANDMRPKP